MAELGQYAQTGVEMVARWSFNSPNPTSTITYDARSKRWAVSADYWIMLAHKATIGRHVLRVLEPNPDAAHALVYAACAPYRNGSVTLSAVNPGNSEVVLQVQLIAPPATTKPTSSKKNSSVNGGTVARSARLEYVFTAPGGNLSSRCSLLNGHELQIEDSGALPAEFRPAFVAGSGGQRELALAPRSAVFVVLLDVDLPVCHRR